jgi:hypothetical protein
MEGRFMAFDEEKTSRFISLEDQAFLEELGISGMSPGAEYALRAHKEAMDARSRIEDRAEGLRSLDLDDHHYERLAQDTGEDAEELREDLRLFRDLKKKTRARESEGF